MKKAKLLAAVLCSASMVMGSVIPTIPAMADGMKVVTLGADLSDDQKNTMLKYFKVDSNEVQIIYVTNQDERDHLSAYVPLEQIGTRTVSCAYVKPTTSGGIKVRTANLNWVTCNMIASSLSTSGVTNCEVVAACPFEVSGTGALTGIQMAYEEASGEKLDETKKELATEEMVVTGKLADSVGQNDATTVINQAKMQVIADNIQSADEIYNVVVNISNNNNVSLSDDQINTIVNLLSQISQQDYDYSDMQETLERVNDNVTGQAEEEDSSDDSSADTADDSEDAADSIIDNVDESVLGDNVIESSTQDPGLAVETGAADESYTEDSSDDDFWEEFPADTAEDDTTADDNTAEEIPDYSEDSDTADNQEEITDGAMEEISGDSTDTSDNSTDGSSDETDDTGMSDTEGTTDSSDEITDVSQLTADYLDEGSQEKFEKAKTFCQGEYQDDENALWEVMGDDAAVTVTLDYDSANKLSIKVLQKYLSILGNGAVSYTEDGTEKYLTPELNMLDKEMKKIFGIDIIDEGEASADIDVLGDSVSAEDKQTLYEDTMKFFEKLYGETTDSYDDSQAQDVTTDENAIEEVGESYDENTEDAAEAADGE